MPISTANIDKRYASFYLEGREAISEDGIEAEVDLDTLGKQALACDNVSQGLYSITREAAAKMLGYLETSQERADWIRERKGELDDVDPDTAYLAYCVGRIDEVRYTMEQEVVGRMIEMQDGGAE